MILFHYSYYLMAIGYVLCGYYINLLVITSLLVVHELGHFMSAKLFNFNVSRIIIYPFGGVTKISDLINRDINQEILVATSGVIFQFLFYLFIVYLNSVGVVRDYTMNIFEVYNREIIFFNLLPIYPLDGAKIFNLLVSKIFNYNFSNRLTILVSGIFMILYIFLNNYKHNYSYFMIISVLVLYNYKFFSKLKYIYNRFLLERYLYDIRYDSIKIINSPNKMYKNKSHILNINDNYFDEKKYLSKYYFN